MLNYVIPLSTTILSIVALILVTGFRRGSALSPMSLALVMLGSIFGVRPLLMIQLGSFDFYGTTIKSGFNASAAIGLSATIAICLGFAYGRLSERQVLGVNPTYAMPPLKDIAEEIVPSKSTSLNTVAITAIAILLLWLLTMVAVGGGISFLTILFAGRSDAVEQRVANMPAIIPALPVVASLMLATSRIRINRVRPMRTAETLQYWAVMALCVIPPSALGNRRFLIPTLVAGLLGAATRTWNRRISLQMVLAGVAGFLVLAVFPFVRSAGSRTGKTDLLGAMSDYFGTYGVGQVVQDFFVSYDTEMFNYIAYLAPRLGSELPYGLGRGTLGEALLAPLPSSLSPWITWSNVLLDKAFGGGCAELYCPVPSVVGVLYYDLGTIGVLLGMLLIGLLFSTFERNYLRAEGNRLLLLVGFASFAPLIVRGNSISQLWILVQVVLIAIIASAIVRTRSGRSQDTKSMTPMGRAERLKVQ